MKPFAVLFVIGFFWVSSVGVCAQDKNAVGKASYFTKIKIKLPGFPKGNVRKPLVIRDAAQLKKVKGIKVQKQIADAVNFDKQYVVLFAWSGSGQDRLSANYKRITKKVVFTYSPGRTRDLRGHAYCFAIQNGTAFTVVTGRFGGKLKR